MLCYGKTVADHGRVWAWHQTITDPEHLEADKVLRRTRMGALRPVRDPESELALEQRLLTDCNTALGIDLGAGVEGGCVS